MASLLVRNVEPELVDRLRARDHGRSAEAEHRAILRDALAAHARTGADILALLRPGPGLDLDPREVRAADPGRPADLGDA